MSQTETELTCYGLAEKPDEPLLVTDLYLPSQTCSQATTEIDGDALQDFFEEMVARGLHPSQFARIWLHTHPKMSTVPSSTDYKTLNERLGDADWMVMAIASGDKMTATIQIAEPVFIQASLPVSIAWTQPFSAFSPEEALKELAKITPFKPTYHEKGALTEPTPYDDWDPDDRRDLRGDLGGDFASFPCSECSHRFICATADTPYCGDLTYTDKAFLKELREKLEASPHA